jgi:uncharacterized protein (TIGR02466 family)
MEGTRSIVAPLCAPPQIAYAGPMPVQTLFPTRVYTARLSGLAANTLNQRLLRECRVLAGEDAAGQAWSQTNYPGGYTSYNSAARMHQMSPTFAALEKRIDAHVRSFARTLDFDLAGRKLVMTDCWVNVMTHQVVHGLHLHPLASVSGTYYVRTPRGCSGLKFEDPRLERFMAAPPKKSKARRENKVWVTVPAEQGKLVLFESWLRHEVAPNPTEAERISISFNYSWF